MLERANYGRMHAVSVTFILKLEEFKEKVLILKAITFLATKMMKEQEIKIFETFCCYNTEKYESSCLYVFICIQNIMLCIIY